MQYTSVQFWRVCIDSKTDLKKMLVNKVMLTEGKGWSSTERAGQQPDLTFLNQKAVDYLSYLPGICHIVFQLTKNCAKLDNVLIWIIIKDASVIVLSSIRSHLNLNGWSVRCLEILPSPHSHIIYINRNNRDASRCIVESNGIMRTVKIHTIHDRNSVWTQKDRCTVHYITLKFKITYSSQLDQASLFWSLSGLKTNWCHVWIFILLLKLSQ